MIQIKPARTEAARTEPSVRGKCAHCGNENLKKRKLLMYDENGAFGNAYIFTCYICSGCGFTEMYAER